MSGGVEVGCFCDLLCRQALATDDDALLAEDGGDSRLGDPVASGNLLGGLSCLIPSGDVGSICDGQEAFRTDF